MFSRLKNWFFPKPVPDRWAELLAQGLNPILVKYLYDDGNWSQRIEWTAAIDQYVDQPWPIIRDCRTKPVGSPAAAW